MTTTAKSKPGPKAGKKEKPEKPAGKKPGRAATPPAGEPAEASVPLTDLDLTIANGVRDGRDPDAVERYAERYAAKEPMDRLLCTGTRGDMTAPVWVADGGYRGLALLKLGRTSAECLVHWCDTREEAEALAWRLAYRANAGARAMPRTSADLERTIRQALLREPPASTDRHVAEVVDCHRTPVMKVRCRMTEAGELAGKASAEGRYKESEYQKWVTGKGKRPKVETAFAPNPSAGGRAATPEAGWRGVAVADADLGTACERELDALNVRTLGELDALLGDINGMGKVLEAHRTDLQEVVDAARADDGLVTPDTPVPLPVELTDEQLADTPGMIRDPDAKEPVSPPAVRDEKGRPVPAHLLPVFEARTRFRGLSQRVGAVVAEVEALTNSPAGEAIQVQAARQDGNSLSRGVAGAMPYVVCPGCSGETAKKCEVCSGRGWAARLRYDQFPPDLKKACEGPWDADAIQEG